MEPYSDSCIWVISGSIPIHGNFFKVFNLRDFFISITNSSIISAAYSKWENEVC